MISKPTPITNLTPLEAKYSSYIGYIYAFLCHVLIVVSSYFFQRESKIINPYQIQFSNGLQFICYNYLCLHYKGLSVAITNRPANRLLTLRGVIGIVGACAGTLGYALSPLSEAVALQMTTPAMTSILAIFFLSEKYDIMLFLNTVFCMVGVILICKPAFLFGAAVDNAAYPHRSLGIMLCLLGAMIGGFIQVIVKKLGSLTNPFVTTFYFGIFMASSAAVCQLATGVVTLQFRDVLVSLLIGVMQFFSQYLMNKSYTFGNAGSISLIFYSQVPIAYIIDLVFEGMKPQFSSVLGSISIFSCVFVMLYRQYLQSKIQK